MYFCPCQIKEIRLPQKTLLSCLMLNMLSAKQFYTTWLNNYLGMTVMTSVCRWYKWWKVKCTIVKALRLCRGRTAHRGSRGIALLFFDHGTRRGWGVSVTPRPLFTAGKDPTPIVQEAEYPRGSLDRCGKSRSPPGFDPRTVQPVASRYIPTTLPGPHTHDVEVHTSRASGFPGL